MIRIATGHSAIVDVNRGRHEYAIRVGGLAVFNPARRLSHHQHVLKTRTRRCCGNQVGPARRNLGCPLNNMFASRHKNCWPGPNRIAKSACAKGPLINDRTCRTASRTSMPSEPSAILRPARANSSSSVLPQQTTRFFLCSLQRPTPRQGVFSREARHRHHHWQRPWRQAQVDKRGTCYSACWNWAKWLCRKAGWPARVAWRTNPGKGISDTV